MILFDCLDFFGWFIRVFWSFWPLPRLEGLLVLMKKLEAIDAALQIVPADGNCMVWSLLSLRLGYDATRNYVDTLGEQMLAVRQHISDLWLKCRYDRTWRALFENMVLWAPPPPEAADGVHKDGVSTPKKGGKPDIPKNDHGNATPPRVDPPKKRARIGEGKPVSCMAPVSKEVALKAPGSTGKAANLSFMEPAIPDIAVKIEEAYSREQLALPSSNAALPVGHLDDLLVSDEEDRQPKKKRHTRKFKTKCRTLGELHEFRLLKWLAETFCFNYYEWMKVHKSTSTYNKSASCAAGGFNAFKTCLLQGKPLTCSVPW